MALRFDSIPSQIEITHDRAIERQTCNVLAELKAKRQLLYERTTRCKKIKELNREPEPDQHKAAYKFICVCPQYHPCYPCKHIGNVIIDRDVLTKQEHICYLATPKPNFAAPRKMPRFYHKRILLPHATARIEHLAEPKRLKVAGTLNDFKEVISEKRVENLTKILNRKEEEVHFNDINTALEYIAEERRLERVSRRKERSQCRSMRLRILKKQRRQIKKIICVIFEEMKDFLLNDQFLIDENSMLCRVILEQIQDFSNREFYSTSNLREYQKILANNLAVWINKFISALSIYVAQPQTAPCEKTVPPEPETFLPVWDYISASNDGEDLYEAGPEDEFIDIGDDFGEFGHEDDTDQLKQDIDEAK